MATKKKTKKGLTAAQKVGIGVGLTAATVTAVGGYFLYGSKNAKKNRKTVKSWMLKAKAEVLEGLEKAKKLSEDEYQELVDRVVKRYAKSATAKEAKEYAQELKKHWKEIEKMADVKKKPARKTAKRSTKRKKSR